MAEAIFVDGDITYHITHNIKTGVIRDFVKFSKSEQSQTPVTDINERLQVAIDVYDEQMADPNDFGVSEWVIKIIKDTGESNVRTNKHTQGPSKDRGPGQEGQDQEQEIREKH